MLYTYTLIDRNHPALQHLCLLWKKAKKNTVNDNSTVFWTKKHVHRKLFFSMRFLHCSLVDLLMITQANLYSCINPYETYSWQNF